ncbi:hypothetical protein OUZ56_010432 [Daphnia magna]|uniref:Uncharacterized protein n=1 Tax=Daphnia magna TaxID=35525 RepID=A0ABR0AIR6_9CRUS|nr:hypothetical protein OUZ56_010432 [Daphnia magna]
MNNFCFHRSAEPQLVVTRGGLSYDRVRSQPTMKKLLRISYLSDRLVDVPFLQADMSCLPPALVQQLEPVLPIGSVEDVTPPTRMDPGQVEVPNSDPR